MTPPTGGGTGGGRDRTPARRAVGRRGVHGATLVEFSLVGSLFIFTVLGLVSLSFYVFEVQAANWAVQAAGRWSVAAQNLQSPGSGQIALPQCGSNASPPGSPPPKMLAVAGAAAGPFGSRITASSMQTAMPDTAQGTIGCVVTVTLPYDGLPLPFGISLGDVTATATDYVT